MATEVYVAISSTNRTGDAVVGGGGATYAATFSTMTLALADTTYGARDLITLDEKAIYQYFTDGSPYTEDPVVFSGFTTQAANDILVEAAEGERHSGTTTTGVKIEFQNDNWLTRWDPAGEFVTTRYLHLYANSTGSNESKPTYLIKVNSIIDGCFVRGHKTTTNATAIGSEIGGTNGQVKNCVVYDSNRGISIKAWAQWKVFNTVAIGCVTGFKNTSDVHADSECINCVSANNTTDFSVSSPNQGVWRNLASSDATAPDTVGSTSLHNIVPADEFEDYVAFDVHLKAGSSLVDAGYDLTGTIVNDFEGQPYTGWHIGADQPGQFTVPCIFNGVPVNTEIRIYKDSDKSELIGVELSTTDPEQLDMPYTTTESAYVVLHNLDYKYIRQENLTIAGSGIDLPFTFRFDRDFTATSGITGISFNTTTKLITVTSPNDFQDLYSYAKEQWKSDNTLLPHDFPFDAVSAEAGIYEFIDGWDFDNDTSRHNTRSGAWDTATAKLMNIKTLGSATGQPYYTQGGLPSNTERTGTQDTIIDITANQTDFKLFLREQGKTFDEYDLVAEQSITALVAKTYFVPLANETDSKVSVSDATIAANTPYTGMTVTYLDGVGFTTYADATVYPVNSVVTDGTRWFITALGGTSNGVDLASDIGVTDWTAYSGERDINGTYYPFQYIFDGNSGSKVQIYEKHQHMMRQATNIDVGDSVRGDTADLLMYFLGDVLYTNQGCYIDNFVSAEQLDYRFTDSTGSVQQFPAPDSGITFNGLVAGSQVKVFATGTTTERFTTDSSSTSEQYVATIQEGVDYTIMKAGYRPIRVKGYTIGANPSTLSIQQQTDRAYQTGVTFTYTTDGAYNTTTDEFTLSKPMTVQQYYSAMIDAWISQATLKNERFPITSNGPDSFSIDDATISAASIPFLYNDGLRVTSSGSITDIWCAIDTVLDVGIDKAEIQQIAGAAINTVGQRKGWNAPNQVDTGTVKMLLKVKQTGGTPFDYTDYLVIEYAKEGRYQGRVVVHDTYPTLEDKLYVVPVGSVDSPIPDTDPVLGVNAPTYTLHETPIADWGQVGSSFSITIDDQAGTLTGEQIANYHNWHIRESNDDLFNGQDPFNFADFIRDNGAKWKTIQSSVWGWKSNALVGVRVTRGTDPHPDFNSMIDDNGVEYIPPVYATGTITNLVVNSRVRIVNTTQSNTVTANEIVTSNTYSEQYIVGSTYANGDVLEVYITYVDGITAKKNQKKTAVVTSSGWSVLAEQEDDTIYNAYGRNGKTLYDAVTFYADTSGANPEIDLKIYGDFEAKDAYNWYCYALHEGSHYEYWDAITAEDVSNIRVNINLLLDNAATGNIKQADNIRIYRSDLAYPIKEPTTSGYGIDVVWRDKVYGYSTGEGLTQQNIQDIATTVAANPTITGIKTKTDELTFTNPNQVDVNVKSTNDAIVYGSGTPQDKWRGTL